MKMFDESIGCFGCFWSACCSQPGHRETADATNGSPQLEQWKLTGCAMRLRLREVFMVVSNERAFKNLKLAIMEAQICH